MATVLNLATITGIQLAPTLTGLLRHSTGEQRSFDICIIVHRYLSIRLYAYLPIEVMSCQTMNRIHPQFIRPPRLPPLYRVGKI